MTELPRADWEVIEFLSETAGDEWGSTASIAGWAGEWLHDDWKPLVTTYDGWGVELEDTMAIVHGTTLTLIPIVGPDFSPGTPAHFRLSPRRARFFIERAAHAHELQKAGLA